MYNDFLSYDSLREVCSWIHSDGSQWPYAKSTSESDNFVEARILILNCCTSRIFLVSEIFFQLSVPSYIISCHNCGHGTDMRGCPQSPLVPEGMHISDLNVNCVDFTGLAYPLICWRWILLLQPPSFRFFVCSSFILLLIWSLWSLLQLLYLFSFTSLILSFSTMTLNCCIHW